jgi:hypothetical protein
MFACQRNVTILQGDHDFGEAACTPLRSEYTAEGVILRVAEHLSAPTWPGVSTSPGKRLPEGREGRPARVPHVQERQDRSTDVDHGGRADHT